MLAVTVAAVVVGLTGAAVWFFDVRLPWQSDETTSAVDDADARVVGTDAGPSGDAAATEGAEPADVAPDRAADTPRWTWTVPEPHHPGLGDQAYVNSLVATPWGLVAGGHNFDGPAVWRFTPETSEWSRVSDASVGLAGGGGGWMSKMGMVDGYLVAVGAAVPNPDGASRVWRTADGVNWEWSAAPFPITGISRGIAEIGIGNARGRGTDTILVAEYETPTFVEGPDGLLEPQPGPGRPTAIWRSEDGQTWEAQAVTGFDEGNRVSDMVVTRETVVAVGPGGIWVSADGIHFERAEFDGEVSGDPIVIAVADTSSGLVAVGSAQTTSGEPDPAAWLSVNGGQSWHRADVVGVIGAERTAMSDVVETSRGLVAVGADGDRAAVWESADGLVWHPVELPDIPGVDTSGLGVIAVDGDRLTALGGTQTGTDVAALTLHAEPNTATGQ